MRQTNPRRRYRELRFRVVHYRRLVASLTAELREARRERDRLTTDPGELFTDFIEKMMDEKRPN